MNRSGVLVRAAAPLLIVGAVLWGVALTFERIYGYTDASRGWGWRADELMFATATALEAIGLVLLAMGRIAGDGRVARVFLWIAAAGYSISALSQYLSQIVDLGGGKVGVAIGGLSGLVGTLVAGAFAVRAGRFTGWRRFALLALGVVQFGATVVLVAEVGGLAEILAEPLWQAAWLTLGIAALTQPRSHSATDLAL